MPRRLVIIEVEVIMMVVAIVIIVAPRSS